MKNIVRYHNDFNKIKLPSFSSQEQNLLYGILTRIKDNETNTIKFLPSELMEFTTQNYTNKELGDILYILRDKFFKADFMILIEDKEREMIGKEWINIFETFKLWYPKGDKEYNHLLSVEMKVNPRFTYLINELTANFTRFELAEFIAISGKYTKTLYRLLKQFRNTGEVTIYKNNFQEFCDFMGIPKSYPMGVIDQKILKPAIKELSPEPNLFTNEKKTIFKNLTYKKIKDPKGRGRGGNVIGIEFNFEPEQIQELESKPKESKNAHPKEPNIKAYCGVNVSIPVKEGDKVSRFEGKISDIGYEGDKITIAIKDESMRIRNLPFDNLESLEKCINTYKI